MIIVVNPSDAPGHSFKGLHAYCSHDAGSSETSHRVLWTETQNIESSPDYAWKVMRATASMADSLKSNAGVKAGRKTKTGPVMHIVVSYDEDEPTDKESVDRDVRALLSELGADPAKMRGKSKPSRRQFANEHEAQWWAHTDTDDFHVHISLNTVHPEHGIRLPTSNNFLKLQKWALDYSKARGTAHKTPARIENFEARQNGEYVKHTNRPNRKSFIAAKNSAAKLASQEKHKALLNDQKKRDAKLYEEGRQLAQRHRDEKAAIEKRYLQKLADAAKAKRRAMNAARAEVREQYRPVLRELSAFQAREKQTFEALEKSFFGRTKNAIQSLREKGIESGSRISRAFRVLSNAGDRKRYFEGSQKYARDAVQRQINNEISTAKSEVAGQEQENLHQARTEFSSELAALKAEQNADRANYYEDWSKRKQEKRAVFKRIEQIEDDVASLLDEFGYAVDQAELDAADVDDILDEYDLRFNDAADPNHSDGQQQKPKRDSQSD